jgi:hypothetical protein
VRNFRHPPFWLRFKILVGVDFNWLFTSFIKNQSRSLVQPKIAKIEAKRRTRKLKPSTPTPPPPTPARQEPRITRIGRLPENRVRTRESIRFWAEKEQNNIDTAPAVSKNELDDESVFLECYKTTQWSWVWGVGVERGAGAGYGTDGGGVSVGMAVGVVWCVVCGVAVRVCEVWRRVLGRVTENLAFMSLEHTRTPLTSRGIQRQENILSQTGATPPHFPPGRQTRVEGPIKLKPRLQLYDASEPTDFFGTRTEPAKGSEIFGHKHTLQAHSGGGLIIQSK